MHVGNVRGSGADQIEIASSRDDCELAWCPLQRHATDDGLLMFILRIKESRLQCYHRFLKVWVAFHEFMVSCSAERTARARSKKPQPRM
jgi:hypothetical protein